MMLLLMMQADEAAAGAGAASAPDLVDQGLLVHMLPYLVMGVTVIAGTQLYRGSDTGILPHKFLGSSIVYWTLLAAPAADSSSPAAGSPAAAAPLAPSTGNKKKQRKSQSQQQVVGAGQSSSGLVQPAWLLPELLQHLEFTEELDTMIRYVSLLMVNLVAAALFRWFLTPSWPLHVINLLVTCWVYLLYTLHKVEWAHQIIAREEKMYMTAAAVVGAITAFCLLVWVGPPALAIDVSAASEELTSRVAAIARAKLRHLPPNELQPITERGPLGTVLALVGGVMAGLLMAPGIRYGRLLQAFLEPPAWAHNLQPKLTDKLVTQAGFALQLLLVPLWVTSMVDVLRLPDTGAPVLRGVVMLLAGVLQARAVPCLLQAFLYNVPLHAHVVTKNPAASDELAAKSVKRVVKITLSQASKVCIQLLVVPAFSVTSAMGYLLLSFASPLAADSPVALEWDKKPSATLMCVAGFVGWWSSAVFMLWAGVGTLLARMHSAALAS